MLIEEFLAGRWAATLSQVNEQFVTEMICPDGAVVRETFNKEHLARQCFDAFSLAIINAG